MTPTPPETVEMPPGARRDIRWFMVLLLVTVVVHLIGLPLALGALVTAPAAIVFGIKALVGVRRMPAMAGLRVGISMGLGLSTMAIVLSLGMILFYGPLTQLAECNARALTNVAERECQAEYEQGIEDTLSRFGVSAP